MGFKTLQGVIAHGPETRSSTTATILHAYALRADDETRQAYLSRNRLARYAKTNVRVIRRSIKELVDKGFLVDTGKRTPGPSNKAMKIYQVNYTCNSLCFTASPNEHYPEGAAGVEYERLYPRSDIEQENGF